MKRILVGAATGLVLLGIPARASADLTAFIGVNTSPSNRTATGLAVGFTVAVVGVELEYSNSREDALMAAPSLKTGMANLMMQTPGSVGGVRFYFTLGGGIYREQLGDRQDTSFATDLGGGVKITLAGPVQLRLDYRTFALRGNPIEGRHQRFYVGANLAF